MIERPDLGGLMVEAEHFLLNSSPVVRAMSSLLIEVIEYAAALECNAAELWERLRAIEWDEETDTEQCPWCLGIRRDGHLDGCEFAAILAAAP